MQAVTTQGPVSTPTTAAWLEENVKRDEREEREWKAMSTKWRATLSKLVNTLDTVNKNRHELERQKALIRHALTTGKFDQIERERALALYSEWNRGIQMIPLYPEDYTPRHVQPTATDESVYLSPLAGPDAPEPVSAYVYELDEGLLATQQKRDWIHVAPPALLPSTSTVIVAPPLPTSNGTGVPIMIATQPQPVAYPAIAGWRVRRLGEGETLSFDDVVTLASDKTNNTVDTVAAANAIAATAERLKGSTVGLPPQVVTPVVNSMLRDTRAPFLPGMVDAYRFQFRYHPLTPSAVTTTFLFALPTPFPTDLPVHPGQAYNKDGWEHIPYIPLCL